MAFLKIQQNSQENRVSFLIKSFFEKGTLTQVFFCDFYEIFKNIFLTENLRTTASVMNLQNQCSQLLTHFYLVQQPFCSTSFQKQKDSHQVAPLELQLTLHIINNFKKLFLKSSYILMVISSDKANIFQIIRQEQQWRIDWHKCSTQINKYLYISTFVNFYSIYYFEKFEADNFYPLKISNAHFELSKNNYDL